MSLQELSRRLFLKGSVGALVGLTAIGCENRDTQIAGLIQKFYPELYSKYHTSDTSLTIVRLEGQSGQYISIYNHTDYGINILALGTAYKLSDALGSSRKPLSISNYPFKDNLRRFTVIGRQGIKEQVITIVPNTISPPAWDRNPDRVHTTADTQIRDGTAFSYIQLRQGQQSVNAPFDDVMVDATKKLADQICRQTLEIKIFDDYQKREITDPGETELAEKIVCGSIATAMAMALTGSTVQEYRQFVASKTLTFSRVDGTFEKYNIVSLDNSTYSSIPRVGPMLVPAGS